MISSLVKYNTIHNPVRAAIARRLYRTRKTVGEYWEPGQRVPKPIKHRNNIVRVVVRIGMWRDFHLRWKDKREAL